MEGNLKVFSTAYPTGDVVKYGGHGMPRPQIIYGIDGNDVQKVLELRKQEHQRLMKRLDRKPKK